MYRLEGLSAAIREITPPALTEVFAAVTTLGDPVFLVGLVAAAYWLVDDRESAARLVGYTLVAVAVTISLKEGLALPRPPAATRAVVVDSGSRGFPSGHAIGATVVYGGVVLLFDRLRTRRAVWIAAALVALVSLSRVVIGVHYLGDVVAGVAVGVAVLGLLWFVEESRSVYPIAALAVVPGVVVTGGDAEAIFVFGAGVGATTVAFLTDLDALPTPETVTRSVALLAAGAVLLGASYWLSTAVAEPAVALLSGATFVGGALALPALLRSHLAPDVAR